MDFYIGNLTKSAISFFYLNGGLFVMLCILSEFSYFLKLVSSFSVRHRTDSNHFLSYDWFGLIN
jgi:hypothetical protein